MVPLVFLYEVSIVLSTMIVRRRAKAAQESGGPPENAVPLLFVLGLATARWRNRRGRIVSVEGV